MVTYIGGGMAKQLSQNDVDSLLRSHKGSCQSEEEWAIALHKDGAMKERKRIVKLIGAFLTGEIKTQWELRVAIENDGDA